VFTLVGNGRASDSQQDLIRLFLCSVTVVSAVMVASETLVRVSDAEQKLCPELSVNSSAALSNASTVVLEARCSERIDAIRWWWPSEDVPMFAMLRAAFCAEVIFTLVASVEYALRLWSSPVLFDSRFDISSNRAALLSATHLKRRCLCYDQRWWCSLRCSKACGPHCAVRWFAPVAWHEVVRPGAFIALSPPQTSLLIKAEAERLLLIGAGIGGTSGGSGWSNGNDLDLEGKHTIAGDADGAGAGS